MRASTAADRRQRAARRDRAAQYECRGRVDRRLGRLRRPRRHRRRRRLGKAPVHHRRSATHEAQVAQARTRSTSTCPIPCRRAREGPRHGPAERLARHGQRLLRDPAARARKENGRARSDDHRRRTVEFERAYFGGVYGSGAEPANCARLNEIQVGPYRYQKALSCFAPNDTFGADGGLDRLRLPPPLQLDVRLSARKRRAHPERRVERGRTWCYRYARCPGRSGCASRSSSRARAAFGRERRSRRCRPERSRRAAAGRGAPDAERLVQRIGHRLVRRRRRETSRRANLGRAGRSSNVVCDESSAIGAGTSNIIGGQVTAATEGWIGSGGYNLISNAAGSAIGAGYHNTISATAGVIGGGQQNTASAEYSVIGGGDEEYDRHDDRADRDDRRRLRQHGVCPMGHGRGGQ